ncbi:hypothetical protein Tco_0071777 [Tanacetum coccineum]
MPEKVWPLASMSCVMQLISQVKTLDCSIVKLSTTPPRKPQHHAFGAEERVEVAEVPVRVLEHPEHPRRLPDQPHRPHGNQPQQLTASLVPELPKPLYHQTSNRC